MGKITFNREHLLEKLKKATQFLPKKPVMPAHEQFRFEIKGLRLSITATDSNKQVTLYAQALKSESDVAFCVPAWLVFKTIELLLEEEVTFVYKEGKDLTEGKVELKSGKSKYKMPGIHVREFPIMADIDSPFEASFTGASFGSAAETAKRYTDVKNTVEAWQGICMRLGENNNINFFGSTGHQICKIICEPRSINKWEDIIIPAPVITAALKCINDSDIVDITHNKGCIEINTEEVNIMASAIDTKYPDCDVFFRLKDPVGLELNTMQVMRALQRVALYSPEEMPIAKFDITTTATVIMADNQAYSRDAEETIEAISEIETKFGVNVHSILNAMESFQSDTFTLYPPTEKIAMISIEPSSGARANDRFFVMSHVKI